jgi:hypothetical protein
MGVSDAENAVSISKVLNRALNSCTLTFNSVPAPLYLMEGGHSKQTDKPTAHFTDSNVEKTRLQVKEKSSEWLLKDLIMLAIQNFI